MSSNWLDRLNKVTDEFVKESRSLSQSDKRFDFEPDHAPESPRIRRLNSPVDFNEEYWKFASEGPFADVAQDILGPNFKFHHSKLNLWCRLRIWCRRYCAFTFLVSFSGRRKRPTGFAQLRL